MKSNINQQIEKEAVFGIVPIAQNQKIYSFFTAFLVLSGYCIATWSYTQGAYLATLVGFKQLLISAFFAAILMLSIYQLPVILSVRYGIDIWIWFRTIFGQRGIKIMALIIIAINFPWYAVCADLFASSVRHVAGILGLPLADAAHLPLALLCVFSGTLLAYRGVKAITWTTWLLVPLLLVVGVLVIIIGFTAIPAAAIWNYQPDTSGYADRLTPYLMSIEANFAFVITLVGGMAAIPRLTKGERSGYWAGVLGQGLSGSFFVVVGAVIAIATQYTTGTMSEDPAAMLAALSMPTPLLACGSLFLVAFSNIGTQAVGAYSYGVMLKSSFRHLDYRLLIFLLAAYVSVLCFWGGITTYFGSFLTISACVYAPLAALLFVDFFFVRQQRISLPSAFALPGHDAYTFTAGINWIGFFCIAAGMAISLAIYNPVSGQIHHPWLFRLTPTGCAFIGTGLIYYLCSKTPRLRAYMLQDRKEYRQ